MSKQTKKTESINSNKKAALSFKLKRIIRKSKNYYNYYYPQYIRRRIKDVVFRRIFYLEMHLDVLNNFKEKVNEILEGMPFDLEDVKGSVVHFPIWYEYYEAYAEQFDYKNPDSWEDPLLAFISKKEPDYFYYALEDIGKKTEIKFVKNFVESLGCDWYWEEADYPVKYILVAEGKIGTITERIKYLNAIIEEKGLYNFLKSVYNGDYIIEPDLPRRVAYSYIKDERSRVILSKGDYIELGFYNPPNGCVYLARFKDNFYKIIFDGTGNEFHESSAPVELNYEQAVRLCSEYYNYDEEIAEFFSWEGKPLTQEEWDKITA